MKSISRLCVLTGCQMEGLVSALRILFPYLEVEGFHTYRLLGDDREAIRERLLTADLVFALPMEAQFGEFSSDRIERLGPRIQFVPAVVFAAFHPDITYLERLDGSRVQTPMTDYNSAIAVAAYLSGFDVERTLRLYNAYTYQALGHFDLVESSSRSLLADFASRGLDMTTPLSRWLQHPDAFMYSMNHPRSFVLADVAVEAARAAGLAVDPLVRELEAMPDRLAEWVVYPVYKEIAARLGKVGNYHFKLLGSEPQSRMTLLDFVAQSFARYDQEDISRWAISKRITVMKSILRTLTSKAWHSTKPPVKPVTEVSRSAFAVPQTVTSIDECFFYHTIDLPQHGTQAGGWDLRGRFSDYIGGVDLTGQRVLDVGAASGFLSFSAEEAGAKEVVSFDLDTADRQHLLPFADSEYVNDHATWSTKQTAGFQRWKNAYWFAHRLRQSKARVVYGDVYALPDNIGQFDVVILGAILEHLADPIRALASVAKHAGKTIVINTDYIDTDEPMAQFNGRPDRPEASYIFWTYSLGTYRNIMEILGFEIAAIKRNRFVSVTGNGEPIEADRVALVCRRKGAEAAPLKLRTAA